MINLHLEFQNYIFRIFYYIPAFLRWIKFKVCKKDRIEDIESQDFGDNVTEYWEILENVIESKFQSDYENSTRDDFTDLKKDMENIFKEKLASSIKSLKDDFRTLKNDVHRRGQK